MTELPAPASGSSATVDAMSETHTDRFAEHVARRDTERAARDATRVTWRKEASGGWSGLGPAGALVWVKPSADRGKFDYGDFDGRVRVVRGSAPARDLARKAAARLITPTTTRPKEDTIMAAKSKRRASTGAPKSAATRAQREAKATEAEAAKTAAAAETTEPEAETPKVEKLDPPSKAERDEAATGEKPKVDTDALSKTLMTALKATVKRAERVDAKSGMYFRIRVNKATIGYVTASGKGLRAEVALDPKAVPPGVETKPGSGKLPVIFYARDDEGAKVAASLFEAAARMEGQS